jgi:hypothetical protein
MHVKIIDNTEYRVKILCSVSNCGHYRNIITFDDDLYGIIELFDFLKKCYKNEKREIVLEFLDTPLKPEELDSILPEKYFLE